MSRPKLTITFTTHNEDLFSKVQYVLESMAKGSGEEHKIESGTSSDKMGFSEALSAMKFGKRARMRGWFKDSAVRLRFPSDGSEITNVYLCMETGDHRVPWMPNPFELIAEDWEIVD